MKKIIFVLLMLLALGAAGSPALAGTDVTLAWDANTEPDLAGYKIYWGTETGNYTQSVDVGKVTKYTIKNLPDGIYYFAATAYDDSNNESGYSNEVSDTFDDQAPPSDPKNLFIEVKVQVGVTINQ